MSDDWRHKECKKCKGELPTDVEQYSGVCCNCTWEETFGITWDEYIKEYNKKKKTEEMPVDRGRLL